MSIIAASNLITCALSAGRIDLDTARRAQSAIREKIYYGQRMTQADRARIVTVRFGIA